MSIRYPSAISLMARGQENLWQVSTKQHVGATGGLSGLGTFLWLSKRIRCHVKRVRVRREIFTLVGIQVKNEKEMQDVLFFNRSGPEVPKNASDFLYLGETKPLSFDFFRPKQPNAKTGDQCLISYLSLEPNASVYDFNCETSNWQWAACAACFLPSTFHDYSKIVARGLCSRSKFDNLYEV